jgi:hypothetical protein
MSTQTVAAAGNAELACVALLEALGFIVVCETSGGMEEWLALRADLHLRAESPLELLDLYSMRQERGAARVPTDAEVESLLAQTRSK